MTVVASEILNKASTILNDAGVTRWTTAELLGWLNDGQLDIATRVPNSNANTVFFQLAAGVKQFAPGDVIRVVEFVKNVDATGNVAGLPIRSIERKVMDAFYPQWTTDTTSSVVQHTMYNPEDDNNVFYVWPPQPSSGMGYIEIIYSQVPSTISASGSNITISDFYKVPLIDFVVYRALGKDSEYGSMLALSQEHKKAYSDAIGIKFELDTNASNNKA